MATLLREPMATERFKLSDLVPSRLTEAFAAKTFATEAAALEKAYLEAERVIDNGLE